MTTPDAVAPVRVLVVCWGNSARSILAEALFRHLGGEPHRRVFGRHRAQGREPAHAARPRRGRAADRRARVQVGRTTTSGQQFDYVITVCDDARGVCPVFPGVHESLHWGYPDPAKAEGTEEERLAAFRSVFTQLGERIHQFLPIAERFAAERHPVELA